MSEQTVDVAKRCRGRFISDVTITAVVAVGVTLAMSSIGYGQSPDPIDLSSRERFNGLTVFWIPALGMEADIDSDEPGGDVRFEADVDTGSGWGLRYQRENARGIVALGVMYMGSRHTERITDSDVDIHAAYLTVNGYHDLCDRLALQLMVGVGGVVVDFSRGFDDTGGLAGLATAGLRFQLIEGLYAVADIGGFLWGYPGETIAYGYVSTLGLTYRF